jgi:hypothetical protein
MGLTKDPGRQAWTARLTYRGASGETGPKLGWFLFKEETKNKPFQTTFELIPRLCEI